MSARDMISVRRLGRLGALGLLCSTLLASCSEERTLPGYARLNRSNAVDFVCQVNNELVPRANCRTPNTGVKLFAFVSQSARGEIATIDLGTRELLDSRAEIPGYTFVPVGESPTAIVVPPNHPGYTYVANYGSRDVYVFDTHALVPPALSSAPLQIVPLSVLGANGPVAAAPTQMVLDPTEAEDALLVAVPELGQVLRLPIRRCAEGAINCQEGWIDTAAIGAIPLQGSASRAPSTVAPASASATKPYEQLCKYEHPAPPPATPLQPKPEELTPQPRPRALAVDAFCRPTDPSCQRRLLVADDALPLIHVIDLAAFGPGDASAALRDPIATGAPTRELVVTPRVPVEFGSEQETQFIYAIDANDGSVLVVEGSQVLNVNAFPNPRADRIELPNTDGAGAAVAATLAVLTPDFDASVPSSTQYLTRAPAGVLPTDPNLDRYCPQPDRAVQDPALLRGVFVAVALSDGKVRLIDVHDMTLDTPDGTQACRLCPTQEIPLLERHHLRFTLNPEGIELPSSIPAPETHVFVNDTQQFPVRENGTSGSPDAPSLDCLACNALDQTLPKPVTSGDPATATAASGSGCPPEKPALLCAVTDPWSGLEEFWSATYEGALPAAVGGGGVVTSAGDPRNLSGAPELLANLDFCGAGVLGDEDVAAAYVNDACDPPLTADVEASDAPGDQLTITSTLVDSAGPRCAAAHRALTDDKTLTISFPIRRAYRDRLIIGSQTILPARAPDALVALRSYEEVVACMGGAPLSFAVRTRRSFTVEGLQAGYQHNVVANAAGRCTIDAKATARKRGRARQGCTFNNGMIAFRMRTTGPDESEPKSGIRWLLRLRSPIPRAYFDANNLGYSQARVLPVQMRYLDVTRGLYLVDIHERGLVPIPAGDQAFPTVIDSTLTVN